MVVARASDSGNNGQILGHNDAQAATPSTGDAGRSSGAESTPPPANPTNNGNNGSANGSSSGGEQILGQGNGGAEGPTGGGETTGNNGRGDAGSGSNGANGRGNEAAEYEAIRANPTTPTSTGSSSTGVSSTPTPTTEPAVPDPNNPTVFDGDNFDPTRQSFLDGMGENRPDVKLFNPIKSLLIRQQSQATQLEAQLKQAEGKSSPSQLSDKEMAKMEKLAAQLRQDFGRNNKLLRAAQAKAEADPNNKKLPPRLRQLQETMRPRQEKIDAALKRYEALMQQRRAATGTKTAEEVEELKAAWARMTSTAKPKQPVKPGERPTIAKNGEKGATTSSPPLKKGGGGDLTARSATKQPSSTQRVGGTVEGEALEGDHEQRPGTKRLAEAPRSNPGEVGEAELAAALKKVEEVVGQYQAKLNEELAKVRQKVTDAATRFMQSAKAKEKEDPTAAKNLMQGARLCYVRAFSDLTASKQSVGERLSQRGAEHMVGMGPGMPRFNEVGEEVPATAEGGVVVAGTDAGEKVDYSSPNGTREALGQVEKPRADKISPDSYDHAPDQKVAGRGYNVLRYFEGGAFRPITKAEREELGVHYPTDEMYRDPNGIHVGVA